MFLHVRPLSMPLRHSWLCRPPSLQLPWEALKLSGHLQHLIAAVQPPLKKDAQALRDTGSLCSRQPVVSQYYPDALPSQACTCQAYAQ